MLKQVRTGIAISFFFVSLIAAAGLILNSRFVNDFGTGLLLYLVLPIVGGGLFGVLLGRPLDALARVGSSEAPVRALEYLWAAVAGFAVVAWLSR